MQLQIWPFSMPSEWGMPDTRGGISSNCYQRRQWKNRDIYRAHGKSIQRLYEHTQDINNEKRNGTSLSNYIWKLKKQNIKHKISWKILSRRKSFNPATRRCNLCLREKFCIIFKPEGASLNSRSELFSTCRHRKTLLLENT